MDTQDKPAESGESTSTLDKLTAVRFELRRGATTSLGVKVEEMLDGAEKKVHELAGAKKSMQAHVKNLLGIVAAVDGEVEKSIPDLPTATLIKTWLSKTVAATENLAGHLGNVELQAIGEVAGYKAVHDYIQKVVREIDDNKAALAKAVSDGRVQMEDGSPQMSGPGPRLPGVRPGPSIAQQRKTEGTEPTKPRRSKSKD